MIFIFFGGRKLFDTFFSFYMKIIFIREMLNFYSTAAIFYEWICKQPLIMICFKQEELRNYYLWIFTISQCSQIANRIYLLHYHFIVSKIIFQVWFGDIFKRGLTRPSFLIFNFFTLLFVYFFLVLIDFKTHDFSRLIFGKWITLWNSFKFFYT